jgi:hypothetical protein
LRTGKFQHVASEPAHTSRAPSRQKGPKLNIRSTTTLALAIATALFLAIVVAAQKITSLNTTAQGQGTITISDIDKHEISSVMVILKENGEAELTFYADLQLSAQGTWSAAKSPGDGINLKITGGVVSGNANGTEYYFCGKTASRSISLTFRRHQRMVARQRLTLLPPGNPSAITETYVS